MATLPAQSDHYTDYVRRLVQLHALIRDGEGDSEEADELRDAMDDSWGRLSPEESDRIRVLSADLNTIARPLLGRDQVDRRVYAEARRQLLEAGNAGDWGGVLALLRENCDALAAHEAAYVRGRCWAELGDLTASLQFIKEASRLAPESSRYAIQVVSTLAKLKSRDEAIKVAIDFAEGDGALVQTGPVAYVRGEIDILDAKTGPVLDAEGRHKDVG